MPKKNTVVEDELDVQATELDLQAWIEGVTSVQHVVVIYGDLATKADIDVWNAREFEARQGGEPTSEIVKIVEAKRAAYRKYAKSALEIRFQGRTVDAINRSLKESKEAGFKGVDEIAFLMEKQIVEPVGVNAAFITNVAKTLPGEYVKMLKTWNETNQDSGVTVPLSQGS